jgi:hypothetical protein
MTNIARPIHRYNQRIQEIRGVLAAEIVILNYQRQYFRTRTW